MLLAGPTDHTSTQYMDFVKIFSISVVCLLLNLLILVGVELLLCIVVILSKNVFWSQVEHKIVLFYTAYYKSYLNFKTKHLFEKH